MKHRGVKLTIVWSIIVMLCLSVWPMGLALPSFAAPVTPPRDETTLEYLISSTEHFEWINSGNGDRNGRYRQTADITVTVSQRVTNAFTGTYDGGGYTITLKTPLTTGANDLSLFHELREGTLRNIHVNLVDINYAAGGGSEATFGGIVANMKGGLIENCSTTGKLIGRQWKGGSNRNSVYIGGIVGTAQSYNNVSARIVGCYSNATVYGIVGDGDSGTGSRSDLNVVVAGIVGRTTSDVEITSCMYEGEAAAGPSQGNYTPHSGCYLVAGGIVGYYTGGKLTLNNNYIRKATIHANNSANLYARAGKLVGLCSKALLAGMDYIGIVDGGNNYYKDISHGSMNSSQYGDIFMGKMSDKFTKVVGVSGPIYSKSSTSQMSSAWVYTQGSGDHELAWRSYPAPVIEPETGSTLLSPKVGETVDLTITAPTWATVNGDAKKLQYQRYTQSEVGAATIRYSLSYAYKGTAGAPEANIVQLADGRYSIQFSIDSETKAVDSSTKVQYKATATQTDWTDYTTPEALMKAIGTPTNGLVFTAKVHSDTQLLLESATTTVTWNASTPTASAIVRNGRYVAGSNVYQSYNALKPGVTAQLNNDKKTATIKISKGEFDKISPGASITLDAWIEGRGVMITHTYQTGQFPPTPVFNPDNTGIVGASGVTLSCSDTNSTIYYTTEQNNGDLDSWTKYLGGGINFAAGATELVIKAYSQNLHGLRSMVVTQRYDKSNRPVTGMPSILMGANKETFSQATHYEAGTLIHLYHADIANGTIYYTTNGQEPTAVNGIAYNQSSPFTLPTGVASITLKAVFIRAGYLDSQVLTAVISIRLPHSTPLVSIKNGDTIPNNSLLYLRVKDDELPSGMVPEFYVKLEDPNYGKIPGIDESYDPLIHEARYTEAQVNAAKSGTFHGVINNYGSGFSYNAPGIWYVEGSGDPIKEGQLYIPETPELRTYVMNTTYNDYELLPENITAYVPARGIKLTGKPDATVTYSVAVANIANTQYSNSGVLRLTYTLREAALAPTAYPDAGTDQPSQVAPSTTIRLQSGTVGAKIYYTTDGTIPDPVNNPGTKLFTNNVERDARPGEFFTVMAIAVVDGLENSSAASFTYQVPEDTLAPYANLRSGSVPRNSEVKLSSSTAGAVVYYTISNASLAQAHADMAAARDTNGNLDVYSGNLTRYDELDPPVITESTYIVAVALVNGMESRSMEYSYTVYGQIGTPQASLETGAVVTRGSVVSLTSSTSGSTMYYTTDGSDPQKKDNTAVSVGTSVVIDAEPGKVVTVRAFADKNGMTSSDTATFSYRISTTEAGITANPEKGEEMAHGTRISLSTDVTGATIYYTTNGETPTRDSSSGSTATLSGNPGEIVTVKAIAYTDAGSNPPVAVFTYTMRGRTPAPTASIPTGAITFVGAEVKLTAPEGVIYYTTDGKTPTTASAQYVTPVEIAGSMVLKAFAQADGKEPSETVEYRYTKAGQAAVPYVDVPAGAINIGTKVSMFTDTEGATIYYTTDNRDAPSVDDLSSALVYTDPIEITRPVTLKMIAYKKGLEASIVATVIYTVIEPDPPVPPPEEPDDPYTTSTERLASRRDYAEQDVGPTFKDVVLRDKTTLAVLSAETGRLPANVTLSVRQIAASAADRKAVTAALAGYDIAALFDVELLSGGVPVQPDGTVEVGLPIPQGYGDGIVTVCRVTSNGATQIASVRRAGNMAYIMVNQLDRFAISVPDAAIEDGNALWWIILIVCGLGGILLIGMAVYLYRRRRTTGQA